MHYRMTYLVYDISAFNHSVFFLFFFVNLPVSKKSYDFHRNRSNFRKCINGRDFLHLAVVLEAISIKSTFDFVFPDKMRLTILKK